MAGFTPEQVNTAWGFYGTLRDTFPMALPMEVYNAVVGMLGGDPQAARQYLDSTAGRHFVDALTFSIRDNNASAKEVIAAIRKSQSDPKMGFWKGFKRFKPYESTPADLVNRLLEDESPISTFVDQLAELAKSHGGKVSYASVLVPEQTAEVTIDLHGQSKTFSIGINGEDIDAYLFDDVKGYDTENPIVLTQPVDLFRQFDDPTPDPDGPGVNGPEATFQTGPDTDTPHWSDPDADRGPHFRR